MKLKKETINVTEFDTLEDIPEFFDIYEPDAYMEMQEDILWTDF